MRTWRMAARLAKPMADDIINAYDIKKGDLLEHKYSNNLYEVCGTPVLWHNSATGERATVPCYDEQGRLFSFGCRLINTDFNIVR